MSREGTLFMPCKRQGLAPPNGSRIIKGKKSENGKGFKRVEKFSIK
jgi:hypothetical protein